MDYARALNPEETLGVFKIEKFLGRGNFKSVYLARTQGEGKSRYPDHVALSVPHIQDKENWRLLENEYRMIKGLDHPGIVKAYGLESDKTCFFIVMEVVEGETLDHLLARKGAALPLDEAISIIRKAGLAIDYAHECLAIHRDLKPENIIVCPDGAVKLLDFGLARLMAHSKYKAATRVGTMAYMPPEQFEGAAGLNADIWSLGMTFYHLITRTLPFTSDNEGALLYQILNAPPNMEPIDHLGHDPRLSGVISKALSKDPEKRYMKAAAFIEDLQAVARHAAAITTAEGEIEAVLRAHFPLIYIQTFEEDRTLESLERIRRLMSGAREVGLYIWSETRGLRDSEGHALAAETAGDPLVALKHVIRSDAEGIYVFLDIHRHLTPVAVRLVRDAIWSVKRHRKSLVFLSPVVTIPKELESDTTLMFYHLPDMEQLKELAIFLSREQKTPDGTDPGVVSEAVARALLGLTRVEAERVLNRSMIRTGGFSQDCVLEVLGEKQQIVRKAGLLEFYPPTVGFDDVGGLNGLKEWFGKRRQAFTGSGKLYGLPAPKGVVLAGAPGCGKSLSAKALATEWGVPLLRLDMGRIYSSLLGSSEANLRKALHTAEAVSPCILWIDELEKAFGSSGAGLDGGVAKRVFGAFLNWLEERTSPVFVAATANSITRLPPEFTRKGRFDDVFFVGLPGKEERRAIFSVHLRRKGRQEKDFDLALLSEKSDGFSGAEIEESVISALYQAFEEGERPLGTDDMLNTLAATVPMSRSRSWEMEALHQWAAVNARSAK
jgi:ATP-dependent 26S proteasome regulatory subunit